MKTLILSSDAENLEVIRRMLSASNRPSDFSFVQGNIRDLPKVMQKESAELLIIDELCRNPEDISLLEQMLIHQSNQGIILISNNNSSEFLLEAMRIGVREIIPAPIVYEMLRIAIARIEERISGSLLRKRGKVLAFTGCKGGAGTTFLAVNFAWTLASTTDKKVALIDLDRPFGDALFFVSENTPAYSIGDIVKDSNRLDMSFLNSCMTQILPNFNLLAAAENAAQVLNVKAELIQTLITLSTSQYDFVILDLGRSLDSVSVAAMDQADIIFPVMQATLPFLNGAKRLLTVLKSLDYSEEKTQLIINRYEKKSGVSVKEVEQALKQQSLRCISNSFKNASNSVNKGIPIFQISARDSVTKELQEWAKSMVPKTDIEKNRWMSSIFSFAK